MTNWCIKYYSSADNLGFQSCVAPPDTQTKLLIPSGGIISFTSQSFIDEHPGFSPDVIMSGGMASGSGHVRLHDAADTVIDTVGWGAAANPETFAASAHAAGEVLTRDLSSLAVDTDSNVADFSSGVLLNPIPQSLFEEVIIVDVCGNIDEVQAEPPEGMLVDENGDCFVDVCPLIDGLQIAVPDGYEINENDQCVVLPLEDATLFITELYPNAPSVDDGQEFIELYNPNDRDISLAGYELQLGPSFTKTFVFAGGSLASDEYRAFSDSETGIVLPNSTGQKLRLVSPAGEVVSESELYSNAQDDESWSLIEDQWIWTNQITSNAANKPYLAPAVNEVDGVTSVLAPCPAGKFRNPATNRCKNIESAVSQLAPCDEGEERNPETNRCRKVGGSASSLTPCKPGHERNPETNRCRSVSGSSSDLKPCEDDEERNPDTNRCRKISAVLTSADGSVTDLSVQQTEGQLNWPLIGGTLLLTSGYMVYEWRRELQQRWRLWRQS